MEKLVSRLKRAVWRALDDLELLRENLSEYPAVETNLAYVQTTLKTAKESVTMAEDLVRNFRKERAEQ